MSEVMDSRLGLHSIDTPTEHLVRPSIEEVVDLDVASRLPITPPVVEQSAGLSRRTLLIGLSAAAAGIFIGYNAGASSGDNRYKAGLEQGEKNNTQLEAAQDLQVAEADALHIAEVLLANKGTLSLTMYNAMLHLPLAVTTMTDKYQYPIVLGGRPLVDQANDGTPLPYGSQKIFVGLLQRDNNSDLQIKVQAVMPSQLHVLNAYGSEDPSLLPNPYAYINANVHLNGAVLQGYEPDITFGPYNPLLIANEVV